MDQNLKQFKKLIETNCCLDKLVLFDIENGKLIADLSFGYDTYQIYFDNCCFLVMYYDSYESFFHYHLCESHKTLLQTLNEVIQDSNNGSLLDLFSKKWWSFLPEWIILRPNYLERTYCDFFINEILSITDYIDYSSDLSTDEKLLIEDWVNTKTKEYEYN